MKNKKLKFQAVSLRELFDKFLTNGGAIVLATECTEPERLAAMIESRYAENHDSAYILRPQSWLDSLPKP